MGLVLVVFAVHLGRHVNDFYVPESDFFDFRDKAVSLREGEWPDHFKRPPLYSAMIALISAVIPGHHRELIAAEIIGVVSALVSLILLYRIAYTFFPKIAFLFAWFWAFHPSTLRMAIKPKSEMFACLFILWAFYAFIVNKKWAYVIGFLASTVRYEGALIIASIGLAELAIKKERVKTLIRSLLAGSFIVLWTFLQSSGSKGDTYFSYFNDYQLNIGFIKSMWQGLLGFLPSPFYKICVIVAAGLSLLGIVYGRRKHRRETIALVVYIAAFVLMHVIWPMPNIDYTIMISWAFLIFVGLGLASIWVTAKSPRFKRLHPRYFAVVFLGLSLLMLVIILKKPIDFPQYNVETGMLILFIIPCIAGLIFLWRSGMTRLVPALAGLTIAVAFLYTMLSSTNGMLYGIRYSKAEFRLVGEWFQQHSEFDDRIAVAQPTIIGYYAGLDSTSFVRLVDLPQVPPDSLYNWMVDKNITYIAWLSDNLIFETDNAWLQWKMTNRGWDTIAFLAEGKSQADFALVEELRVGPRWAFIYKL